PHLHDSQGYLAVHDSHMRSLEKRLLIEDGLSIDITLPSSITISGTIDWQRDELDRAPQLFVNKELEKYPDGRVCGHFYIYQACVCIGSDKYEVFRYDNVHRHDGHKDNYHAHWLCDGKDEVVWIGYE